jgi:hypothetical protein
MGGGAEKWVCVWRYGPSLEHPESKMVAEYNQKRILYFVFEDVLA